MPPVIVAFAAWAGISVAAAYLVVAATVISAGMAVYGTAQARRAERDARNQALAGMKDRMATRIATESPHRYIYGRAKVGADIVAVLTSGERDQFKHLVCVHAAHECDAIEAIYINNKPVGNLDGNGFATAGYFTNPPDRKTEEQQLTGPNIAIQWRPIVGTVKVFSGTGAAMQPVTITASNDSTGVYTVAFTGPVTVVYDRPKWGELDASLRGGSAENALSSSVQIQRHLGGANDTVDTYLQSMVGASKWPSTSVLRGQCYTVITLDLDHAEFQSGIPPIHAVIRGKKLYDPRSGLTAWSQNPALVIRDYLTGPLCGVPAADLPTAQFIAAANVCDEVSPTGGARYTINGTVTSDQGQAGVLESMVQAMAGGLVATTWDIYAGKYVAPVAALLQSDIVGSLSVTPGVSDANIYNGVRGQYIGPENNFVQTDFKPYQNGVYRAEDGRDLYNNLDFPFTESLQRVTNLARIFTEDQRNGFTIRAEFSLKAWPLKVGQRITFTSAVLGHNAKVFRITDKSYSPTSAVQLSLKEDDASIWDYADATVVDSTPNSDLPNPWKLDPLASLSCTSGESTLLRQADGSTVPRILASWPATAQGNGVEIEVEWRAVQSTTWERTTVSSGELQAYLSPITPGFFYAVRARTANPSLGVTSIWTTALYQVEVFTAKPTVYMWAANKPATPAGAASYAWPTGLFGAAPAGWSLTIPTAPAGGNVSLWAATVSISDIVETSSPFNWSQADVASIGYAPTASGQGPAGYSNARVFAYQRKATAPAGTPGAVDYDFTTGTITTATLLNGWQKTIPASDGNPLYVTSASASAAGTTDTIATGEWSGAVVLAYDGGAGTPGFNTATVTLYQRTASATAPAKPSAATTYTFATGALTGLTNGWNTFIPTTGGQYLHTTFATAIATTATDSIAATEWATVQLMYDATDLIAAKAAADAANLAITDMARDDLLSPVEKPAENLRWNAIVGERPGIDSAAAAMGITTERTAYTNAYNTLSAYITGFGAAFTTIPGTAITIVGATYRANFKNYFDAKQAVLNAIAAKSATVADANSVVGMTHFRVLTQGGARTNPMPAGTQGLHKNGVHSYAAGRSYMLVIVRRSDAAIIWNKTYDVFASTAAAADLTVDLNNASPDSIVLVFTGEEPFTNRLANGLPAAMYRCGASRAVFGSSEFRIRSAYCLIGVPGCGEGNGAEFYQGAVNDDPNAWIDVAFTVVNGNYTAMAGYTPRSLKDYGYSGDMNATVGAPAGTQVAGVDASTVAAGAQAGNTMNTEFTASAGSSSFTVTVTNGGPRNLTLRTATTSGGTGPFTYTWSEATGGGFQLVNATSQTVTLRAGGFDEVRTGKLVLNVTDKFGRLAVYSIDLNVTFTNAP